MNNFQINQLHITGRVQTPIRLNQHKGSAIRGALFYSVPTRLWALCRNGGRERPE